MTQTAGYHDPDENQTSWERTRRGLHRNVDTICRAWPHAQNDLAAIGYGTGRTYDGTSRGGNELTAVEAAAANLIERTSPAVAFIAEVGDVIIDLTCQSTHPSGQPWNPTNSKPAMHEGVDLLMAELPPGRHWPDGPVDLLRRIERLASAGDRWWPSKPLNQGDVVGGVTVGERGNQAELCALCELPVVSGRDIHGQPLLKRDATGAAHHASCYYDRQVTALRTNRKPPCQVDGCQHPTHAKGLCQAHYNRWHRTGVIGGAVGIA